MACPMKLPMLSIFVWAAGLELLGEGHHHRFAVERSETLQRSCNARLADGRLWDLLVRPHGGRRSADMDAIDTEVALIC